MQSEINLRIYIYSIYTVTFPTFPIQTQRASERERRGVGGCDSEPEDTIQAPEGAIQSWIDDKEVEF